MVSEWKREWNDRQAMVALSLWLNLHHHMNQYVAYFLWLYYFDLPETSKYPSGRKDDISECGA